VTVRADEGEFEDGFYRAALHGCCDQTSALIFINPLTGNVVFVDSREDDPQATGLPSIQHWESQTWRYVAFHDRYTELEPLNGHVDATVVGLLQYGPATGATSRIAVIRSRGDGTRYRLTRLSLVMAGWQGRALVLPTSKSRTAKPPSAITGFSIRIDLSSTGEDSTWTVTIPVVNDQPRTREASMPADLSLRVVADSE
jgi:hypothetical protein